MRLISAQIRGAGRLRNTTIKLDQKVIAIVGPNEAGKTTLLKALAYVDGDQSLEPAQRSRALPSVPDSTPITSLRYRVSDVDRAELKQFDLAEVPTEFFVSRRADGKGPNFAVTPEPRKSEEPLEELAVNLGTLLDGLQAFDPIPIEVGEEEEAPGPSDGSPLLHELQLLRQDLERFLANPIGERDPIETLRERADIAVEALNAYVGTGALREALPAIGRWVDREDPREKVIEALWNLTPDVVMFAEADRNLATTYVIDDDLANNTPAALANVARLAGLDLKKLVQAVQTGQVSRRDTLKNKANLALAAYFKEAWQQSDLKVELNVESNVLRIGLVEDGVHASVFDERSAGLRMFVTLTAFLAARNTGRPTVLLIDEAETHLHIDAQADLVQMFAKQDKADKVIYTTHSPGCLPADLGVGIRAVVPDADEASHVENNFWRQEGGGFTSLMFAMGASAAAFTPARCAVIAEGATDMILLPTLMRAAIGQDALPYQVAPGLSEMPPDSYPNLDFQAAKVAFLVDGDGGGDRLAEALGRALPDDRIVTLEVHGIENTLDPDFYCHTFLALLRELNPDSAHRAPPTLPDATSASWAKTMEAWAEGMSLRVPTKQEMANRLIELDEVLLSPEGNLALRKSHKELLAALGISP